MLSPYSALLCHSCTCVECTPQVMRYPVTRPYRFEMIEPEWTQMTRSLYPHALFDVRASLYT